MNKDLNQGLISLGMIEQRDGSYAVVLDCEIVTPKDLKKIADALERYGVKL